MNKQSAIELIDVNEDKNAIQVFKEKMMDALTLGIQVECFPDEAERAGAFLEDALTEEEAYLSTLDLFHAANAEGTE